MRDQRKQIMSNLDTAGSSDFFHLNRFLQAQEPIIEQVMTELQKGAKTGHWIWFVFPQIKGLGQSPTSQKYAISSAAEAAAYLEHHLLGPRLKECTRLVLLVENRSAARIFGSPDDMKFRSSMTLFAHVFKADDIFERALKKYFAGIPDRLTLDLL